MYQPRNKHVRLLETCLIFPLLAFHAQNCNLTMCGIVPCQGRKSSQKAGDQRPAAESWGAHGHSCVASQQRRPRCAGQGASSTSPCGIAMAQPGGKGILQQQGNHFARSCNLRECSQSLQSLASSYVSEGMIRPLGLAGSNIQSLHHLVSSALGLFLVCIFRIMNCRVCMKWIMHKRVHCVVIVVREKHSVVHTLRLFSK